MAEQNQKFVTTNIKTYAKFNNNDKSKNQKLVIRLFNELMNFQLVGADKDGKFKQQPDVDVYMKHLAYGEEKLLGAVNKILNRIKLMGAGKDVVSEPIVFYNKEPYDACTATITFDAYKKDDKPVIFIRLAKRPENSKEWKDQARMYFSISTAQGIYNKGTDYELSEAYTFFESLRSILQAFVSRTSMVRDRHWNNYLSGSNTEGSENKSYNKSSKPSESDDDFDDEFPL